MDNFDRKQCPQCSEQIRLTAKKCPFCMAPQIKKRWFQNPQFIGFLPLVLFLAYTFFTFPRVLDRAEYRFTDYMQKVTVTSSEMRIETIGETQTRTATIIGTVRNDSEITWEAPQYEARFYDKTGKLIDTSTERTLHVALAPHKEQAFRIQTSASRPSTDYATLKVQVRNAEDADRNFR